MHFRRGSWLSRKSGKGYLRVKPHFLFSLQFQRLILQFSDLVEIELYLAIIWGLGRLEEVGRSPNHFLRRAVAGIEFTTKW